MKRHPLVILGLCASVITCIAEERTSEIQFGALYSLEADEAARLGPLHAEQDFSNGVYRINIYGLRSSFVHADEQYLEDKYDIHNHPVAGCVVSEGIIEHTARYNKRMRELLYALHGKDVFAEAKEAVHSDDSEATP